MPERTSILVIGSINADLTARAETLPSLGQTVAGDYYALATGGKGANCAAAAAALGADVTFCGRVGNDSYGQMVRQALRFRGVRDNFISVDSNHPTGFAVILLDGSGQNSILVYLGANGAMQEGDVKEALKSDYQALCMPLEITPAVLSGAIASAVKKGIPCVVDAGPVLPGFDIALTKGVTILSPNETECRAYSGVFPGDMVSCREAAKILHKKTDAPFIVIKLGERGAYVWGDGVDTLVPAYKVHPVDTTAAGDAFTGALTLEYARSRDILAATAYGCAVGALCVTKKGAMASLPSLDEVTRFLQSQGR